MQYTIVYASSATLLIKLVNEHLASGWQPAGGLMTGYSEETGLGFYQAMVKPAREPKSTDYA